MSYFKHKSPEAQQKSAVLRKKNRCTQVLPEDIDLAFIKESDRIEMLNKGAPIESAEGVEIIPQCRICLRRVARENLEIILSQHKKKARVAFQIRVFPHDAYPYICINCQNLLDMFFEFKCAIIKAKQLLVCKKAHMENNGWDDQEYVDLFKRCKQAVMLHHKQIDSLYEENSKLSKSEFNEYSDENGSDTDNNEDFNNEIINNEDITNEDNNQEQESSIKTEFAANENVSSLPIVPIVEPTIQIEEVANDDVAATLMSSAKLDLHESAVDEHVDDDNKVDDDDYDEDCEEDADYNPEDDIPVKKEKKEKNKKSSKDKPPQPVTRQLCDFCGESIRPESVESHRNKHLGIKPYVCSVEKCETTFSSRYNLSKHIKKFHKPGGVGSHPCNICGKVIQGSIGVLKYHQKRHNIDQKSHICQVCGKGFTMKWYLTQHSIIHTGDFPHKCKYCGKRFNNKWSMKTHEKNIHEKKNQILIQSQPQEQQQPWNPENFHEIASQNIYALIPRENSDPSLGNQ